MAEYGEALTDRELDVLECVANGASTNEAALQLSISPNTVKVHLRNIYTKLGVSSRTEATTVALQRGLLAMPGIEVTEPEAEPVVVRADEESNLELVHESEPSVVVSAPVTTTGTTFSPVQSGVPAAHGPAPSSRSWRWPLALGAILVMAIAVIAAVLLLRDAGSSAAGEEGVASPSESAAVQFTETPIPDSNWSVSRLMPNPRARMAAAIVGLDFYQIAGETPDGIVNSVDIYALAERLWRPGTPKLTPVADANAVVLSGEIYVLGGRLENGQPSAVMEAYSPLNDGWRPATSLPEPTYGSVALTDDSYIYLFGGYQDGVPTRNSYRYDPATQTWNTLAPLDTPRGFAAGAVLAGRFYVVGGTDGEAPLSSCEVYTPSTDTWDTCSDMAAPRSNAGVAAVHNKLYVFGGQQGAAEQHGEAYDPANDSWEIVETPMLASGPAWTDMGIANVETRIYVTGGQQGDTLLAETYVFTPFAYQFFIPAASSGAAPDDPDQ